MVEEIKGLGDVKEYGYVQYLKMPYCRGVFKETLRMYPLAPQVQKWATEDTEIGGYKIPKGVRSEISFILLDICID